MYTIDQLLEMTPDDIFCLDVKENPPATLVLMLIHEIKRLRLLEEKYCIEEVKILGMKDETIPQMAQRFFEFCAIKELVPRTIKIDTVKKNNQVRWALDCTVYTIKKQNKEEQNDGPDPNDFDAPVN